MNAVGRMGVGLGLGLVVGVCHGNVLNRLILVDQSDFGKKVGFSLDFENEAPDGQVCHVGSLVSFLGVADGKSWRFIKANAQFHVGQVVHLMVKITPSDSELTVDGVTVRADTAFTPGQNTMTAVNIPAWANGPTDYRLVEKSLTVTIAGTPHVFKIPAASHSPVLSLFENPLPVTQSLSIPKGATILVDATVAIEPPADISGLKPLIDRYGQVIPAKFVGKITSDSQLRAAFKADDRQLAFWKTTSGFDPFGGVRKSGWSAKGTGYYRTVKRNGFWWLQTPAGNPAFYTGVCTAPALQWDSTPVDGRRDLFEQLPPQIGITPPLWDHNVWGTHNTDYVAVHGLNLVRRFGNNYEAKAKTECQERLRAWGFSGQGKWCANLSSDRNHTQTPSMPVIGCSDVPKIDRHFDVFDPVIRARLKASIASQIRKDVNNPYILGYSYGNEYDEIVIPSEIEHILASTVASPIKSAFIMMGGKWHRTDEELRTAWGAPSTGLLDNLPLKGNAADVEALRRFYATNYYATLYHTFKAVDPNHLYFGFWIVPDWWVSDEDWNLIAPNVDVIGFDRYSDWAGIEHLLKRFDKPVLLGEFSFPSWYGGARGFGRYSVYTESDAESGQRYASLLEAASKCPQCVGTMWFQYRDEPITGRGPATDHSVTAGEHYAFGLVDACDLPKYDLVGPVRNANLQASARRLKLTH